VAKFNLETVLSEGLFHCTSIANLRLILETGVIEPNTGQFSYNQALSRESRCHKLKSISLFDMKDSADPCHFFQWLAITNLAIILNREGLSSHILDPRCDKITKGIVLRGEVCCFSTILKSNFLGYLVGHNSKTLKLLDARTPLEEIAACCFAGVKNKSG